MGKEGAQIELKAQEENDPYVVTTVPERFPITSGAKVLTLENLIGRVQQMLQLRSEIVTFLEVVHSREVSLRSLRVAVNNIKSDNFFYPDAEETTEQDYANLELENPRLYMKKLGN